MMLIATLIKPEGVSYQKYFAQTQIKKIQSEHYLGTFQIGTGAQHYEIEVPSGCSLMVKWWAWDGH